MNADKGRMTKIARHLIWTLPLVWVAACSQDDRQLVPNRVLDRPLDAVLACVQKRVGGGIEVLSFNQCNGSTSSNCAADAPQLIGFVTNSERNELAMFRRCDNDQAVVDLDPDAPGHQLVPVGILPSRLTRTVDSCTVISSNVGSCDLSVLDTAGFAAYALELDNVRAASSLVSTVVPRRADGIPLGAAPGDIVAVPPELSLAASATVATPDVDDDGDTGGDTDGDDGVYLAAESGTTNGGNDGGNDDGGDVDGAPGLSCPEGLGGSIYVTFPACELIAELDLATGRVLQSRRVLIEERDGTQVVTVQDTGENPSCPVECPGQFDEGVPDGLPLVEPGGMFPGTLALVLPAAGLDPDNPPDLAELQITYASLFIGGTGSDHVIEFEIDAAGGFVPVADPPQLQLEDAQGVQTIRVTPAAEVDGDSHQFLYVIAGDGSTHVVDRDFQPGGIGVECDTQIDPTQVASAACHPVDPTLGSANSRRAFVSGPGIRAEGGATVTDWTFFKVLSALDDPDAGDSDNVSPFSGSGLVGVGITSFGLVTYVNFGQLPGATVEAVDPIGLMNTEVRPHALWPVIPPQTGNPLVLPLVSDDAPPRGFGGGADDSRLLAPSLRRIDRVYAVPSSEEGAEVDAISDRQQQIARALYTPSATDSAGTQFVVNDDLLGGFDDAGLYANGPPRVNVRDYVQWRSQTWTVEWEGVVPGTGSGTGLIQCDEHGGVDEQGDAIAGGTCRSATAGDTRLVDESANLCDDGVVAGDKMFLRGCTEDAACGLGQRCLLAATGPTNATGICISEQDYDANLEELRQVCAPFISDPCGTPLREYRITRAFQNELWLQAMDIPARAVVREIDGQLHEWEAKLSCAAPVPHRDAQACTSDTECQLDPYAPDDPALDYVCEIPDGSDEGRCRPGADTECVLDEDCDELGAAYLCVDEQCRAPCDLCAPDGPQPADGCLIDDDCVAALGQGHTCFGGTCHQPCSDDRPGCIQSPLPGPRCFPEFVNYSVRLKDSFKIEGTASPFFTDRVSADPVTLECVEDPLTSNLLTSRLRLGADEDATFNHPVWGIPDCPNALQATPADPNPCRITGSRGEPGSALFHWFAYEGEQVQAIRFTNPYMSVVIDLTSLLDLAVPDPLTDLPWPTSMVGFRRARITRGYREEFGARDGYAPYDEPVQVGRNRLVYPVRILPAPEPGVVFVVDAGSEGGFSPRGQVMRIELGSQVSADPQFRVQ
ncbi:MAG: hypothetical protein JKY37_00955 [Nannocystaceae bacterium]|nr:hypothetical protein [Nannocystaceae bacterium]